MMDLDGKIMMNSIVKDLECAIVSKSETYDIHKWSDQSVQL